MKLILSVISILLSAIPAMAQIEAPDTVANYTDVSRLIVTEDSENASILLSRLIEGDTIQESFTRTLDNATVTQRRWNSPLRSSQPHSKYYFDLTIGGPGIGWVNACGQPEGMGIEMSKSYEISWLNMLALKYVANRTVFSIGFGLDWRNYRISTGAAGFVDTENGGVAVAPYPEGSTPHGSRLKIFGMGIPVLITQYIPIRWLDGRSFYITAGAVFNYNSHGSLLSKWTTADGRESTLKTNHIGQRRFSIDFIGMMKIGWGFSAYVRYSPHTVLRGSGQPKFKPFSTGIIFSY